MNKIIRCICKLFYYCKILIILSKNDDFPLDLNYVRFKQLKNNKLSLIMNNIHLFINSTHNLINEFNQSNILCYKRKSLCTRHVK